jgi:hypothetical protein
MKSLTSWPTTSNFGGLKAKRKRRPPCGRKTLSFGGLGQPGGGLNFVENENHLPLPLSGRAYRWPIATNRLHQITLRRIVHLGRPRGCQGLRIAMSRASHKAQRCRATLSPRGQNPARHGDRVLSSSVPLGDGWWSVRRRGRRLRFVDGFRERQGVSREGRARCQPQGLPSGSGPPGLENCWCVPTRRCGRRAAGNRIMAKSRGAAAVGPGR